MSTQNLALQSAAMDNASWGKANLTATADQIANPLDGAITADLLTDTTDGGAVTHQSSQTVICARGYYTQSAWIKANGTQWVALALSGSGAYFDVLNGVVGSGAGPGYIISGMDAYPNGWYRCWWVCLCDNGFEPFGSRSLLLYMANSNGSVTYQGNGTRKAYFWGVQLVQSNWPGFYQPTTTAAVNPNVPPRSKTLPIKQNLILQSETADNAAWTKSNVTISANAITAPDGNLTADGLVATSTGATLKRIFQSPGPVIGLLSNICFSAYIKAGAVSWVQLLCNNQNATAFFNLSGAGSVGTVGSNNGTVSPYTSRAFATIENVGNGWYRCSVMSPVRMAASGDVPVIAAANADTVSTYAASDTSTPQIYVWGIQCVQANWPGAYVATTTSIFGSLRFPPRNKSLLGLQNLVIQSEAVDDAAWVKTTCSITANAVANPLDGAVTADAIVDTAANTDHRITSSSSFGVIPGVIYTWSAYVKSAKAGTPVVLLSVAGALGGGGCYFNLVTGIRTDALSTGEFSGSDNLGNGWYRVWVTGAAHAGSSTSTIGIAPTNAAGGITYLGDGTASCYVYGAQMVQANWPGSYTPTTTAIAYVGPIRNRNPLQENLLQWGNDLSQSPWAAQGQSSWVANQAANPIDGALTAGAIHDTNGVTNNCNFRQNPTAALAGLVGQTLTYSAWVKAGTQTWCMLGVNNAAQLNWFDLTNGVTGLCQSGSSNCGIQSYGNGWYRCWVTFVQASGVPGQVPAIYAAPSNTIASFTGTGSNAVFVYSTQINHGNYPGPPALVGVNTISSGPLRSKVIPLQNLLTFSEQFDNAAWTKVNATVTADQGAPPFGSGSTADAFIDSADGSPQDHQVRQTVTQVVGSVYTFSCFLKATGTQWAALSPDAGAKTVFFDLTNGVMGTTVNSVISSSITPYGNGWYRCSVTFVAASASTNSRILPATSSSSTTYTGAATSRMLMWGAQQVLGYSAGTYVQVAATALNVGAIRRAS